MFDLLELFYNHPAKRWHFEHLVQESGLSRAQTNYWLGKSLKEGLVRRVKPKGRMPYYLANYDSPHYQNSKRLYGLQKLHESGLLDYLSSLEKAEVVVLFGSFSRWDWYDKSDIDLFIYGDVDQVSLGRFMQKLKRDIQIFSGKSSKDLSHLGSSLLRNIIKGVAIKGTIPKEIIAYAAI